MKVITLLELLTPNQKIDIGGLFHCSYKRSSDFDVKTCEQIMENCHVKNIFGSLDIVSIWTDSSGYIVVDAVQK